MGKDNFHYSGTVIHGAGNGKKFGFPTVNIRLTGDNIRLSKGVYAVEVLIENQLKEGMLYVGTRPTLNFSELSIEINIFNFSEEIYDYAIRFNVLKKIRDELVFDTTAELIKQIKKDQDEIMEFFKK
jgi:riboflavin kinase / FMN adenylyltransferase